MARGTSNWVMNNGTQYYRIRKIYGKTDSSPGKMKTFLGKTKKEALRKQAEYETKLEEEVLDAQRANTDKSKQIFGEVADKWIDAVYWSSKGSDRTKRLYSEAWKKYIAPLPLYQKRIKDIDLFCIQDAYNSIMTQEKATASGLRSAHKLMRKFYDYLAKNGYGTDFTGSLSVPERKAIKSNDEITIWTDEELSKIMNSFDSAVSTCRIRFLIVLAYYTGCRISELLGLTYDDITDEGVHVYKQVAVKWKQNVAGERISFLDVDFPKTVNSDRIIPLCPEAKKELEIHRAWQKKDMRKNSYKTNYLFTTASGGFYDKRNLARAAKYYYDRIGIDAEGKGFHTYRHTFATNLCRAGVPIQTASILLGHSDISITLKYYTNVNVDAKLAAVQNLGRFAKAGEA